jgi:hypothetical protein
MPFEGKRKWHLPEGVLSKQVQRALTLAEVSFASTYSDFLGLRVACAIDTKHDEFWDPSRAEFSVTVTSRTRH